MTTEIRKRLDSFLLTLPRQVRSEYREYRKRSPAAHSPGGRSADQPYWILLPQWLHRRYCRNRKRRPAENTFLRDVLWGQYCLFLSVRIHDDLFDGHTTLPSLVFAADQFLFEAEQTFARWMANERMFWKQYRSGLQTTIGAILRVDELQRSPASSPLQLVQTYADVNAVLKIGSFAVCLRYHRSKDVVHLNRFMEKIAAGSQILDDFQDLTEDLKRKRFNYVALRALHMDSSPSPRTNVRHITKQVLFSHVTGDVMGEVMKCFSDAYRALGPLHVVQARTASKGHLRYLKSMQQEMLSRRADLLFRNNTRRQPPARDA